MSAFGVSIRLPPSLAAFSLMTFASRTPPFDSRHSSVWSRLAKQAGSPFALVADDVMGLI
ncbi:hypothetical protein ACIG54_07660 [Streptomyces achromogenes]|uniref:hypothetical protein n=1 Tax=Streptomyces achromogenes TaxID=67255 RepID=UPI0037D12832